MISVKLIAHTMPTIPDTSCDEFIAYVARVSNPGNQHNHETAPRLLTYLREHQHWSPFEMAHAVLEINTTRDIGRQILRHRSFSFQELSQRYSDEIDMAELRQTRMQDTRNRQNSIPADPNDFNEANKIEWWIEKQSIFMNVAKNVYKQAIELGIAKEVARAILPEGLTMTRMYMAGSLRSWIHYIDLRTEAGTQKEHREIAEMCRRELAIVFPSAFGPVRCADCNGTGLVLDGLGEPDECAACGGDTVVNHETGEQR